MAELTPSYIRWMMEECTERRCLEEEQYRWLKLQAGSDRSIAAVVRELIDAARARPVDLGSDAAIRYLLERPGAGSSATSVTTLDEDLYGS